MSWTRRGRGGWGGPWPGRGPFSYLPPWQRPGWLYGRGACWWLYNPNLELTIPPSATSALIPPTQPFVSAPTKEEEIQMLEGQMKDLESYLDAIRKRLEEIKK
jgi:hypothetical protein